MKKVIEHKKAQVLEVNEYYQYDKYEKMKMSINDLTPEKLEKGIYKKNSSIPLEFFPLIIVFLFSGFLR